jgi:hypothetical protein
MMAPPWEGSVTILSEDSLKQHIRRARGKFAAMAASYFLGVFNDNFYKQAACLMAAAAAMADMQGCLFAVYTLPFIVLAAPAGWMADRFSKRTVVIGAKVTELAAAVCGAVGICCASWPLIVSMVFLMGTQATVFSPALNGSIPELYPASYVLKANSLVKMIVTVAILVGIAAAGEALGVSVRIGDVVLERGLVAGVVVAVAVLGIVVSLGVPRRPAAAPAARFPWTGPADTIKALGRTRSDPLLAVTIAMDAFVWFVATLQIAVINWMGGHQFGLDEARTTRLVFAELVGVAIGGPLAGKLAAGARWFRVLVPAGLVMGVLMVAMIAVPAAPPSARFWLLLAVLGAVGVSGGLLLVPLESFIQIRPAAHEKGAVIAAANFAAFCGILLAGLVSIPANNVLPGTVCFAILGVLTLAASGWLRRALRRGNWT